VLAAGLGLAGQAGAIVVDQQQIIVDGGAAPFRVGGPTDQVLAQTFTAGVAGRLWEVRLPVSCFSGTFGLQVQTVAGSVPSGTVVSSVNVQSAGLPPSSGFQTLRLPSPPAVIAGDRLALVFRSTGSCEVSAGPTGDSYPRGDGFFRDRSSAAGQWTALGARADLPFQTLVEPAGQSFPEDDEGSYLIVRCFLQCLGRSPLP